MDLSFSYDRDRKLRLLTKYQILFNFRHYIEVLVNIESSNPENVNSFVIQFHTVTLHNDAVLPSFQIFPI